MTNMKNNKATGVKLLGKVKEGKLVLDTETLKKVGGAADKYRPVNAPFDCNVLEEAHA